MKFKLEFDDKGMRNGFIDFRSNNKIAIKNTLNITAFETRKNAQKNIRNEFINRNAFTARNVFVDRVKTNDINKMQSKTGASERASYMAVQELGGIRPKKGKIVAMPQRKARMAKNRAKPVSKENYVRKIKSNTVKGKYTQKRESDKARGVSKMAVAYKKKKFLNRNGNIYTVRSFSSRNGKIRVKLEHIYHISKKPLIIKKQPWLEPATVRPSENISFTYLNQLEKLLKVMKIK